MQTGTKGEIGVIRWKRENDILYIEGTGDIEIKRQKKEWIRISKGVKSLIVGDGITSFDSAILEKPSELEKIHLPASFNRRILGMNFFTNLQILSVDERNPHLCADDCVLFDKEKAELIFCSPNKSGLYQTPKSVIKIGCHAFSHCFHLVDIQIPETTKQIETSAFYNCKSLKTIHIPDNVEWIGEYAFACCESLTQVYVSKKIRLISDHCFRWCDNLKEITITNIIPPLVCNSLGIEQHISLYVPAESIKAYHNDDYWMRFKNILPLKPTTTEHYLNTINCRKSDTMFILDKLSAGELETIIKRVDWWLALENNCEEYDWYQELCNNLFRYRKKKLNAEFVYNQENIDRIMNLNERFEKCCILLKEEVIDAFTRMNTKKHNDKIAFNFHIDGGIHIRNSHIDENLVCGPISPKYKERDSLSFQINTEADFDNISQFLILNINTNYSSKVGIDKNKHISYAFYHYYKDSYLSLSDMLNIEYMRGIWRCIMDIEAELLVVEKRQRSK